MKQLITISTTGRWVIVTQPRYERGASCAYCGTRYDDGRCVPVTCMLCGTVQCSGNGLGDGCCRLCHHGYLPGWSRTAHQAACGYARCGQPAAGWVTRRKPGCLAHLQAHPRTAAGIAAELVFRDSGGSHGLRWEWRDFGVLIGNEV